MSKVIKRFLSFAYGEGITETDFSPAILSQKKGAGTEIPSVYTAEEMSERMDSDKKAIFRINTAEGEITDYGAPVIHVEINNPNLSKKQRNEIIRRKDEMKDMIRQVQLATAIKTIGTGTAGAFSQKVSR